MNSKIALTALSAFLSCAMPVAAQAPSATTTASTKVPLAVQAFAGANTTQQGTVTQNYEQLVAQVKAGDTSVDYLALRNAYATSPQYDPYGTNLGTQVQEMIVAYFRNKDCAVALKLADKILAIDFVQIDAHFVSSRCYDKNGNANLAKYERAIFTGLVQSILGSGDGKSPATAYSVVALDEESVILSVLGLNVRNEKSQSLINDNGHSYDRIEVVTPETTPSKIVFFNIDRPLAALGKELRQ